MKNPDNYQPHIRAAILHGQLEGFRMGEAVCAKCNTRWVHHATEDKAAWSCPCPKPGCRHTNNHFTEFLLVRRKRPRSRSSDNDNEGEEWKG